MIDRSVDMSEMASHTGYLLRRKPGVCIKGFQEFDMVECFPLGVCSMRWECCSAFPFLSDMDLVVDKSG